MTQRKTAAYAPASSLATWRVTSVRRETCQSVLTKRLPRQYNKNRKSHNMPNAADIPALIASISAPRLHSYRAFFQPQTDEELLAIYRWHEDLCAHFNRILTWAEIVMRNRFHTGLSLQYGTRGQVARCRGRLGRERPGPARHPRAQAALPGTRRDHRRGAGPVHGPRPGRTAG